LFFLIVIFEQNKYNIGHHYLLSTPISPPPTPSLMAPTSNERPLVQHP